MLIDEETKNALREKFEQELKETVEVKVFTRRIVIGNENLGLLIGMGYTLYHTINNKR